MLLCSASWCCGRLVAAVGDGGIFLILCMAMMFCFLLICQVYSSSCSWVIFIFFDLILMYIAPSFIYFIILLSSTDILFSRFPSRPSFIESRGIHVRLYLPECPPIANLALSESTLCHVYHSWRKVQPCGSVMELLLFVCAVGQLQPNIDLKKIKGKHSNIR